MTVAQHEHFALSFDKTVKLVAIAGELHKLHRRTLQGVPFWSGRHEQLMKQLREIVDETGDDCPLCKLLKETSAA